MSRKIIGWRGIHKSDPWINNNEISVSTANRALISNAVGILVPSLISATELGYLSGVTSGIQAQLNLKAPLSSPAFTDIPTAPTAADNTNTGQIATTAFVQTVVNNIDDKYLKRDAKIVSVGTTTTLDVASNDNFIITLTQNTTLAFNNVSSRIGGSGTIVIIEDNTGGYTFTLPTEAKTPNGDSIVQITTANSINTLFYFIYDVNTILINYIGNWT